MLDNFSKVSPSIHKKNVEVVWVLPPEHIFKLNFDSSKLSNGKASFRFTIRDHLEGLCHGAMALSSDCSILQAEAWGLCEGVKAARFLNISSLIIEGDILVVINSIRRCWKVENFIV